MLQGHRRHDSSFPHERGHAVPRGPDTPRRLRRRPRGLACNVPRSGRREARRQSRAQSPHATPPNHAEHRPTEGDAPHRRGPSPTAQPSPGSHLRTPGTTPSVSIQDAFPTAAPHDGAPTSLTAPRPERELTENGAPARDTTHRLSSPTRHHGYHEHAEPHETRKRPEATKPLDGREHRAHPRGGSLIPTSPRRCGGGFSPHLASNATPRSTPPRLKRAPLPL